MDLDEISSRYPITDAYPLYVRFMLKCVEGTTVAFPSVASGALQTSRIFWDEGGEPGELEAARIACWTYLKQTGGSIDVVTPEHHLVRAIICTLYAEPSGDAVELLDWFLAMAQGCGVAEAGIDAAAGTIFRK